jgi:putative endonuclease
MTTWQVYIIQSKSGKLYTGITTDIKRRLDEHKKKKGAKFFRFENPQEVVFVEACKNRSYATKREIEIKKLTRDEKLKLIESKGV